MIESIKSNERIISNLKYIGLDKDFSIEQFRNFSSLNFRPVKMYDERKYMVYKYVNIADIEILLSPTDRITSLSEKYSKASPLFTYLDSNTAENMEKHITFLKMVKNINIQKIEEIEFEQQQFRKQIPYNIKYSNNYLWQVYYSETVNKYFMLVPIEESETEAFFYLLKMKLQNSDEKIFIPISHQDYSGKFLSNSEIIDLENYLWLFTKDWPSIYEIFNGEKGELCIIGKTTVFEKIKSDYKIVFTNKEDSIVFYKLVKALFIIQTNLETEYSFTSQINEIGGLDFYYNNEKIEYKDLSDFIKKEAKQKTLEINNLNEEIYDLKIIVEKQKRNSEEQNIEFLYKQNQLIVYLDCKKSFLGKITYFFKNKNKGKKFKIKRKSNTQKQDKIEQKIEKEAPIAFNDEKLYTIEDLITICKKHKKNNITYKNLKLDKKAIESKIETIENKIENIEQYIKEIEKHKKNIWSFLKYVNKDTNKNLTEGNLVQEVSEKLQKVFEYDDDIEDFGKLIDDMQRKILSKEETDAIYIGLNEIESINNIENIDIINKKFKELKNEYEDNIESIEKKDFDIFGALSDDRSKIKILNNRKHRELEKNKYKLLNIKKESGIDEYIHNLNKYKSVLVNTFNKIQTPYNISLYKQGNLKSQIEILDLSEKKVIKNLDNTKEQLVISKINIKENNNLLFCTNIIFYDNFNKTLPLGSNLSTEVLIDFREENLKKIHQFEFNMNFKINLFTNIVKSIKVIEYAIIEKNK